jgi:hypothetical protein
MAKYRVTIDIKRTYEVTDEQLERAYLNTGEDGAKKYAQRKVYFLLEAATKPVGRIKLEKVEE